LILVQEFNVLKAEFVKADSVFAMVMKVIVAVITRP
jgi:hypothetical protein